MNTGNNCSESLPMDNSSTLRNALMLTPLIGATHSLMAALGLCLMFMVVTQLFSLAMGALRPRLVPAARLTASVLLAATLTSCAELRADPEGIVIGKEQLAMVAVGDRVLAGDRV